MLSSWKYYSSFQRGLTTTCEHCPKRPYLSLEVPRYPNEEGKIFSVRRVVFTIVSHDQGWSSTHPEWQGTHFDSHTFFEARVVDVSGYDRVPRETLTHNLRAEPKFKRNVISWDYRDGQTRFAEPSGNIPTWASGMVPSQWVGALRPGDAIQIIPRAEFRCWTNFTAEARIELWGEFVSPERTLRVALVNNSDIAYRPLSCEMKEIRLVVISEGSTGSDEPLHLTLRYTSLKDPGRIRYEALSYCWGEESGTTPIFLSDTDVDSPPKELFVSTSLQRALKRLRRNDRSRTFWIDLLCIDQSNESERSQQVALMGEIYASAERVSVWLGELDEIAHSQTDLNMIRAIATGYEGVVEPIPGGRLPDTGATHSCISGNGMINFFHDRVFLRQWFQRVWVLQEVWNASTALENYNPRGRHCVSVLCGDIELPWWVIMHANTCISTGFHQRWNHTMPSIWTKLFKGSRDGGAPWQVGKPGPRSDILSVLISGLGMRASDPHDKIFALLIFGEETYDIARLPRLVQPDYTKSIGQMYADFTLWWIMEHRSLKILSAVHTLRHRTWVDLSGFHNFSGGDFGVESGRQPSWTLWSYGDSHWRRGTLGLDGSTGYRACGDRTVDINLLEADAMPKYEGLPNWFIPAFKGIRLGTIAAIRPFTLFDNPDTTSDQSFNFMYQAYLTIFDPSGSEGTWRNAKGDHNRTYMNSPEDKALERSLHLQAHQLENISTEGSFLPCHGRCMFETENGKVGLCPAPARDGDIVVILYGGSVPYILRAQHPVGIYSFVGECFCDGFMAGEAFDKPGDTYHEEVFRLV